MKTQAEIRDEIEALKRLAAKAPDAAARASIAGQINALQWAAGYPR